MCEGDSSGTNIKFDMTGSGPWQISYFLEGEEDNILYTQSSSPHHKVLP